MSRKALPGKSKTPTSRREPKRLSRKNLDHLNSQLDQIESAQLVWRLPDEELAYLFKHALTQETAYLLLLKTTRERLHLRIGESLERLYPERRAEGSFVSLLAYHFEKGGASEKAYGYLIQAADQARVIYSNKEAAGFYQSAIAQAMLLHNQEGGDRWRTAIAHAYENLGDIRAVTGQSQEAMAAYQNALEQLPGEQRVGQARLYRKISEHLTNPLEQIKEKAQVLDQAEAVLGDEPTESKAEWWQEWINIQMARMSAHYWRLEWREMQALADKTRPAVEQYGTPNLQADFMEYLFLKALARDRFAVSNETLSYAQAMLTAALESRDESKVAHARFELGFGNLFRHELNDAEENLELALAAAERFGDAWFQAATTNYLALCFRKRGQVNDVREYVARGLVAARSAQTPQYTAMAKANLAWADWRDMNLVKAEEEAETALSIWLQDQAIAKAYAVLFWTAQWPLLGLAVAQSQMTRAFQYARDLLAPTHQPFPEALESGLQSAIQAWENGQPDQAKRQLDRVVNLGRETGYL